MAFSYAVTLSAMTAGSKAVPTQVPASVHRCTLVGVAAADGDVGAVPVEGELTGSFGLVHGLARCEGRGRQDVERLDLQSDNADGASGGSGFR